MPQSSPPDSKLIYYQVKAFVDAETQGVFHAFFGRRGGVSTDIYASLNCGEGSDDNPGQVTQNRKIVAETLGVTSSRLLTLYQEHGTSCITVEEPWLSHEKPKADAFVTDKPGLALAILTADCTPVLFYGTKSNGDPVIGAAHAGWRGAVGGVLESCIEGMVKLGAQRSAIRACIGPCIGKESYEIDQGFYDQFMAVDKDYERFFETRGKAGHYMFDLPGFCAHRLHAAGLTRVYIKELDTYFNEEEFFSYRRATHRREVDYGRQVSAIVI